MRAQTQVIQFLLFFLIGFYIFSSLIVFLYHYGLYTQKRLTESYEKLLSNYLSAAFVDMIVFCQFCNYSEINLTIPRRIIEDVYEINLTYFYIHTPFYDKRERINHHNLNYSYNFQGSVFSESKVVIISQNLVLPVSVISFILDKRTKRLSIF